MTDLTKTIADLLETNWALTGDNHKDKITFRRGEPFDLTTRFRKTNVSIEICKLTNPVTKRTLATEIENEIVPIHIHMLVRPQSEEAIASLLDNRDSIVKHIRAIIKSNQQSISGYKLISRRTERHVDEYDSEPPVLHTIIEIVCKSITR